MEFVILGLLIVLNGFFALSEIALVSSRRSRLEQKAAEGHSGASIALKLLADSENFLSAIQVGITLIGIVTGVFGGLGIADDVTPLFRAVPLIEPYAPQLALGLTVLCITYISIVIGELVPKTVALSNPEGIACHAAPVVYYFSILFYPFVRLLSFSTAVITKVLRIQKQPEQLSEGELRQMLKIASHEGVIDREQKELHEQVFYFSDKKAKHIMTHRTELEWIDLDKPPEVLHEIMLAVKHSKTLCCKGGIDQFLGVLYIRDYLREALKGSLPPILPLVKKPPVVQENLEADKLPELLRRNNAHLCFVVNEYGGLEGIITMHDIIEHIMGQIPDEGEQYEPYVFVREDGSVLVSGDAPVETLAELITGFTVDFETVAYSTVAGFVLSSLRKVPELGDTFTCCGFVIEIVDMDRNRIDKILISRKKDALP